jgi:hypothetical protein
MENREKAELLEKGLQHLMGKILDMARISELSERSFKQFERTTKIEFNGLIRLLKDKAFGIVENSNTNKEE